MQLSYYIDLLHERCLDEKRIILDMITNNAFIAWERDTLDEKLYTSSFIFTGESCRILWIEFE